MNAYRTSGRARGPRVARATSHEAYQQATNDDRKSFAWTPTAESIRAQVPRGLETLDTIAARAQAAGARR
jgi:hypothetical protein